MFTILHRVAATFVGAVMRPRALAAAVTAGCLVALPAVASAGPAAAAAVQPVGTTSAERVLSYADEFAGDARDASHWGVCYHYRAQDCTNQWNKELQVYKPANVTVADGAAHLTARKESATGYLADGTPQQFGYTSGFISTQDKVHFTYGYVEFRAKVPKGQGLWPALWMMPQSRTWPPEIDIMEYIGSQPDRVYMNRHAVGHSSTPIAYVSGGDLSTDWHTYAVDWRPDSLTYYVDGVQRGRITTGVPQEPMYLIANLAVGGVWPGSPDATTAFPATFSVDYVRVWDAGNLRAPAPATVTTQPAPVTTTTTTSTTTADAPAPEPVTAPVPVAAPSSADHDVFGYGGAWSVSTVRGEHFTNVAGATATITAEVGAGGGTVSLQGILGRNKGLAAISIDGGPEVTASQYRKATTTDTFFTTPTLPEGDHTIRIRVTGAKAPGGTNSYVAVTGARLTNGTLATPAVVQPAPVAGAPSAADHTVFGYGGAWSVSTVRGEHFTKVAGATATITAKVGAGGGTVSLQGILGRNKGLVAISIDGGPEVTASQYRKATTTDTFFTTPTLPEGDHTIRIRVTGAKAPGGTDSYVAVTGATLTNGTLSTPATVPVDAS